MANGAHGSTPSIEQLASARFPKLTGAELLLVRTAPTGGRANCRKGGTSSGDPANEPMSFEDWDADRGIRAELIRWLCVSKDVESQIDPRGLTVVLAKIVGRLDLSFVTVRFPLSFIRCGFTGLLSLRNAVLPELVLDGSYMNGIIGSQLKINDSFYLRRSNVSGSVNLVGAEIRGDLHCRNATLRITNEEGPALNLDRSKIGGAVFLTGKFKANGAVMAVGAHVGGPFYCDGGTFENADGPALQMTRVAVQGGVFFRLGFQAKGEVVLLGAIIGGDLDCHEGRFSKREDHGSVMVANNASISRRVHLGDGFSAEGQVSFFGAKIAGDFQCDGGTFKNSGKTALAANGLQVGGNLSFLRKGNTDFSSEGEIRLVDANLSGSLLCTGAKLKNPNKAALTADGIRVERDLFLDAGFVAEGEVHLIGIEVGGDFDTTGAKLERATLILTRSHVGTLRDDSESWPAQGNLDVDAFVYDRISGGPTDAKTRLQWLRLQIGASVDQSQDAFSPQPYRQLAGVLRGQGHDSQARKVLIGLENDRYKQGGLSWWARQWTLVLWATIAYGYRPMQAFVYIAIFVAFGFFVFGSAYSIGEIVPSDIEAYEKIQKTALPANYEKFCAMAYSFDTFVPVIDLGQRTKWTPVTRRGASIEPTPCHGGFIVCAICEPWFLPPSWALAPSSIRIVRWIEIVAGWFFTSLFVAGIAGLVRRD